MARAGSSVSVIGLGRMGSALGRALLAAGHDVTVWNRTPQRCRPLEDAGASVAATVVAAAVASEVTVVCVRDYSASDAVLGAAEEALRGRILVQLTTGTAEDARRGERWARDHGIGYLDGVIMSSPQRIGTSECDIWVSGLAQLYERTQGLLRALGGGVRHAGEPIGRANTLDAATLSILYGSLLAFMQGVALCESEDIPIEEFGPTAERSLASAGRLASWAAGMIAARAYPVGVATLDIHAAAIERSARFAREATLDSTYADAVAAMLRRASDTGHAHEDLPATYEAFRPPRRP